MLLADFAVHDHCRDDLLHAAVARVLSVGSASVGLSRDIRDILTEHPFFLLVADGPGGIFSQRVHLYGTTATLDETAILQGVARQLRMDVLTADNANADPYAFCLITADGVITNVHVNREALDHHNRLSLES